MSSIELSQINRGAGPHFQPAFTKNVRIGIASLVVILALLAVTFDWPFAYIGVIQPFMLTAGLVAVSAIVDVPFRLFWPKLVMFATLLLAALSAWLAWYSGGAWISQEGADQVWKTVSTGLVGVIIGAGVWNAPYRNFSSKIASIPMMFIVLFAFIGCSLWTISYSFSDAKTFPLFNNFVGLKQYYRLFGADVWWTACKNAAIYLIFVTSIEFVLGFVIAVFMDQKIRAEGVFRTIYLYPFALSFIVTGHVWAWILSPEYGLEKSMRQLGWTSFSFDWLVNVDRSIYAVVIAAVWQGTGLVMALMLAGLRGIDDDIWKAARVDGIPKWRTYIQIVLPMMRPVLITTFVIVASGCVRVYDIVVALTDGGPGTSSKVPAQYVYQYLFQGGIGQGLAASTVMLLTSAVILTPWIYVEFVKNRQVR